MFACQILPNNPKLSRSYQTFRQHSHKHTHTWLYICAPHSKFEYLYLQAIPALSFSSVYVRHTDSVREINKNVSKTFRSTRESASIRTRSLFELTCTLTRSHTRTHSDSHSHAFAATNFCVRKGNTTAWAQHSVCVSETAGDRIKCCLTALTRMACSNSALLFSFLTRVCLMNALEWIACVWVCVRVYLLVYSQLQLAALPLRVAWVFYWCSDIWIMPEQSKWDIGASSTYSRIHSIEDK